ncbi:YheC/YheD family protein [Alkalihalophilus lindianensis]|uniref:YheC/YheD family protein n=1 Tax=Alkalihalophilus lindianensis TaxID=1630542 RepID=A0ABU3X5B8_9BACI|nr:YheC/YheD family protein [Alkalihalophilus lindianensis]MDV2683093.1 YheC/YheD family protein [Alkalihalophilus lindianensis]
MRLGEDKKLYEDRVNSLLDDRKEVESKDVIIGILVSKSTKKLKRFLPHLVDLEMNCKSGGLFAFSLNGIDKENLSIKGYSYCRESKKWNQLIVSMPTVIINRISLNHNWESFFKETTGCKTINNFTFNKWEMYEWLSKKPELKKHLPLTELFNNAQDLPGLIGKYKEGYVKPISGSYGKGIYKISKQAESFKVATNKDLFYLNEEELVMYFKEKCKKRTYIFQEVIDLYIGGRPVDMRFILMKNESMEWQGVGLLARKGLKGGIVSNEGVTKHGNSALQNLFSLPKQKAIELRKKITEISIEAASAMEELGGINSNLGNVGIDFGIDKNQHLWIIEINHRNPRHRMAIDAGQEGIYFYSNKLLIDYAYKLAGFSTSSQ